jgi:hypothetical protein
MEDRVEDMRPLLERGIPELEALRRVTLGDVVHDRAHALSDAVSSAREFLCISLDGEIELIKDIPAGEADAVVPRLDKAWREFRQAVDDAQRITNMRGSDGEG